MRAGLGCRRQHDEHGKDAYRAVHALSNRRRAGRLAAPHKEMSGLKNRNGFFSLPERTPPCAKREPLAEVGCQWLVPGPGPRRRLSFFHDAVCYAVLAMALLGRGAREHGTF